MKLKIVSDGTTKGTRVIDAWSGESIDNIQKLVITADATKGMVNAYFEIIGVEYDITVDAFERKVLPMGVERSSIVLKELGGENETKDS